MSSLWTPGGEVPVDRNAPRTPPDGGNGVDDGTPGGGEDGIDAEQLIEAIVASLPEEEREQFLAAFAELTDEQRAEYLQAMVERAAIQQEVVETPIEFQVGKHAVGLFELASLHLQHPPPNLAEAKLAIDAMAGLLAGVAGRLGEHETEFKSMLAQIQLAFVQIQGATGGDSDG
jgi:hypothetical protein